MNAERVVATASDPAFAVDLEGKMIAWNTAATDCLGYRSSDVVGRCCWSVLRGQDLDGERFCAENCPYMALRSEPINRAQMLLRSVGHGEMFLRNASGEATRVNMSTLVVQGESGRREIVHLF